ncbi:DegV family protein [Bhargavaea beijingensis]|uniref:DegV family protein n=1 Tax=Bhargavaea beijingensis TaxID=426756 RepID=A0A1G7DCF6_9BACL|nr:DegV family protein [Bhargavaea beijingensis]MCW1929149.1 DegV family protein [Bhargavaea beijingensis]RSK30954.1 DegV family protein [Bhargavaea beijingensis]SDE49338.1 EDD domain protein, DegV family [Bhargavaea beijingensis]
MTTIHIVTDSTADISRETVRELGIHVVPLSIQIDGKTYVDQVDLSPEEFLDMMAESVELPKSSQPPVGVFKELYELLGKEGGKILSIHMTGGMSGTVESARAAAELADADVTVIDSEFISFGLSFQVQEAAKMAKDGKDFEEILERVDTIRKNTALYVVVDTLENLVKGGRIGKGKAMIGSLMNIKPIAALKDGVYTPVGKARSHKQVVRQLFNSFKEQTVGRKLRAVGISHANGLAMADPLKQMIEEDGFNDVKMMFTSPIISTHTGPGAIGFMYYWD